MEEKNIEYKYYDRELSWLSFNYRVLEEAMDNTLPIYDRIKFMAIYYSNLDEFYRVRVASYRSLLSLPNNQIEKLDYDPEKVLKNINDEVIKQQEKYEYIFINSILPELSKNNINIVQEKEELNEEQNEFLKNYFFQEILPNIQAVLLTKGDVLSFLQDNVIYLSIKLFKKKKNRQASQRKKKVQYAVIKVPAHKLPRFIKLPGKDDGYFYIFLEDIIKRYLNIIFPGFIVDSAFTIKISRDAELPIDDEFRGNLVDKIRKSLSKRKTGMPARFLYDKNIPDDLLSILGIAFNLSKKDFVSGFKYHNLNDLWYFPNPFSPKLASIEVPPLSHPEFDKAPSILHAIKEKDYIIHFPYQSYDYVIRFFNEAAIDPKVEEIKTTQYRLATNSAIVSSLISASRNGKKVTVFVEFKARFDEEANLNFAEQMIKAGIHVIPSLPGLKVHAKAALVIRRSSTKENRKRSFVFLSTGNFNEKTAQIYADYGYFTSKEILVNEVESLFKALENPDAIIKFERLLVPKYNLKKEFKQRIDREIENAKNGRKAYLLFKMNSLEDHKMIDKLYEASQNGVKIDLIIRGICCIVPNQEYSKNIRVIRIVDKYLEHARVFVFYNNGENETFISSADLMKRNLNRRIELMAPIINEAIKKELLDILNIQLRDNVKSRILGNNLSDWEKPKTNNEKFRAQIEIYNYLKNNQKKL